MASGVEEKRSTHHRSNIIVISPWLLCNPVDPVLNTNLTETKASINLYTAENRSVPDFSLT